MGMIAAVATPEYAPDVAAPARSGAAAPWRPEIQREPTPAPAHRLGARKAVALLVAMALAAVLLVGVMVRIAARGLAATTAAPLVPAGRLIVPAPAVASGLPRRYRPLVNPLDLAEMAQFRQRFTATFGAQAGRYAAGLYAEPGRIDLATDTAGWIMYLGVNSRSSLGGPAAAVARLVASLAGPSARSWPVPAGPGGGSARCGVTVFGGTPASVCAWATGREAAALMSPARDTTAAQLEVYLPGLRASLQSG
jgi:hypothetical protein